MAIANGLEISFGVFAYLLLKGSFFIYQPFSLTQRGTHKGEVEK